METLTYEPPLPEDLIEELTHFWETSYGDSYDSFLPMLRGDERVHNRDVFYVTRQGAELAGTCHLSISRGLPILGGLGEVATAPAMRRRGIATRLSAQAGEEFRSQGGQAWFLGTVNPDATRVYHRLGWRKLSSSIGWTQIISGESPEEFLTDYFRGDHGTPSVRAGGPRDRLPMIPLLSTPHDWQVLDANVGVLSTRYDTLKGALSLYPRFEELAADGRGTWFGAYTPGGRLTGVSTARLDDQGGCRVDGFTHRRFPSAWAKLVGSAVEWASDHGAASTYALLSAEDEEKGSLFEGLGFRRAGTGPEFQIGTRSVPSLSVTL